MFKLIGTLINSILPIFILIFIGWAAVKYKLVGVEAKEVCSILVAYFVFPALLFMETAKTKPEQIIYPKWMLAFFLAISIIWLLSALFNRYVFKLPNKENVVSSFISTFPNEGGMGIPLLTHLIGLTAVVSVARANFIIALTLIPLTIFLMEINKNQKDEMNKVHLFIRALLKSIKKPMVLAVILGVIFSFMHITQILPTVLTDSIDLISKSCIFISLFAVGVNLYGIRFKFSKFLFFNLSLKSVISAFVGFALVYLFHISGNDAKEFVLLLAMPTATISTIMALQWNTIENEATSLYLTSTILSLLSLPLIVYIFQ